MYIHILGLKLKAFYNALCTSLQRNIPIFLQSNRITIKLITVSFTVPVISTSQYSTYLYDQQRGTQTRYFYSFLLLFYFTIENIGIFLCTDAQRAL